MMFQILEFKKSKTDKRKGYAKHTFSFIELFIKITIATSIIFSLGVSNICAQDNEEFELEYNLDDDRMDVSNGIESEIPLGTCKQWIAALLVLENSRDMTKQLPILFQDEQEKWVPIIFYRGQEITVQDAIYSLWMFPTESIYKSIAIYLAQSEIEFDSLLQKKYRNWG